jgi:hypothetical protein
MGTIKKRFKIGEYAKGGIIDVEIENDQIRVIARNWGEPHRIIDDGTFYPPFSIDQIQLWIEMELTTHYYAEKVTNWIKEKIKWEK